MTKIVGWRKLKKGELILASDCEMYNGYSLNDGHVPVCQTIVPGKLVGDKGTKFGNNFYRRTTQTKA